MVYVLLANGFEEIEALTPVDILRRCGIGVATAGLHAKQVTGSHNITVETDLLIDEINPDQMELLMLPGGPGHELLDASPQVHALINEAVIRNIYIASICAAPSILGKKGFFQGKKATCFPGYEKYLYGAELSSEKVAADGIFLTGKGAGAAAEFGFALAALLAGKETAAQVRASMQY